MKFLTLSFLILSCHVYGFDLDPWNSTNYIYLAKPSYIYTMEAKYNAIEGELKGLPKIVHAMKISSSIRKRIHYIFEIEETIYGDKKETIDLDFKYQGEYQACNSNNDFDKHTDDRFWFNEQGRSEYIETPDDKIANTNCFGSNRNKPRVSRFYKHCFELNKQYLIIGNSGLGSRQFELIKSKNDQWLHYVKEKAKTIISYEKSTKEYRKALENNHNTTINKLHF